MPSQPHGIGVVIFEYSILRGPQHFGKWVTGANYRSLFIKIGKIHAASLLK
jgi:hypothetical protein